MAPHSSTLAWQIPWTEEPGRLQSMGSLRVGCMRGIPGGPEVKNLPCNAGDMGSISGLGTVVSGSLRPHGL